MKKQIEIIIDMTQGEEEFWKQINEANEALQKLSKPTLWQRVKSWF